MRGRKREFEQRAATIRDYLGVDCWIIHRRKRGYYIVTSDPRDVLEGYDRNRAEIDAYDKPMTAADVCGALQVFEQWPAYKRRALNDRHRRIHSRIKRLKAEIEDLKLKAHETSAEYDRLTNAKDALAASRETS